MSEVGSRPECSKCQDQHGPFAAFRGWWWCERCLTDAIDLSRLRHPSFRVGVVGLPEGEAGA